MDSEDSLDPGRPRKVRRGVAGTEPGGEAQDVPPAYFGIGCMSLIIGFAGGGMIAVLVAKIAGFFTRCTADSETGAPCNWNAYWLYGAVIGAVLVPVVTIWLLRRGRTRARNSQRG